MYKQKLYKEMLTTLETCTEVLKNKRQDYGDSNFVSAAKIASIVCNKDIIPMDVAACLIGIKLARYGNLTGFNLQPLHESVNDTIIDLINYTVLMERERQKENARNNKEEKAV